MSTTVAALHKKLGKLIEAGHGRKPVAINKDTFASPDDGDGPYIVSLVEVEGPTFVCRCDDDGGTYYNKDGSEAGTFTVILRGTRKDHS